MKDCRMIRLLLIGCSLLLLSLSACTPTSEGGGPGATCTTNDDCDQSKSLECRAKKCRTPIEKKSPVARASYTPTAPETLQEVELDASASTDPQDDPISYQWSFENKPGKSQSKIDKDTEKIATFVPDLPGKYVVNLVVTSEDRTGEFRLIIDVTARPNTPPIADAGPDQLLDPNKEVQLDGSKSTDPEADDLTYTWSFRSKPDGTTAKLDDPSAKTPKFRADLVGEYVVELVVTDARGMKSTPDNVTIRVLEGASVKPSLTKVTPAEGYAYELNFKVVVEGNDFFKGAKVRLGNDDAKTTYVSKTKLEAELNLALAGAGDKPLTVVNPNNLSSDPIDFKVIASPAPQLTQLLPPSGHVGLRMKVKAIGKNFIKGLSEVLFQAVPLPTTVISDTEIEFDVDLKNTSLGKYPIQIRNPGNRVSNELTFTVLDQLPKPNLRVLNPPSSETGKKLFFSVHGSGFGTGAEIIFDGKPLKTKRIRSDELQADPELDLSTMQPGEYDVWVKNPDGQISNKEIFRVRDKDPAPILSRILPFSLYLDEVMTDVAIYGQDFIKGAKLFIDGKEIKGALGNVTYRSDTFMLAEINFKDRTIWKNAGNYDAVIENPNGKKSGPFKITVTYRVPSVQTLVPSSWTTRCDTDVEVRGQNFVKTVQVKLGNLTYTTTSSTNKLTYVSDKLLKFKLNATKLTAGTLKVTVENGPQASVQGPDFVIDSGSSLTPYISYVRPSFGLADTTVDIFIRPDSSVTGGSTSFKPGAVVEINGIPQATQCSSFTPSYCYELSAKLDLSGFKAGEYDLNVVNPCNAKGVPISFTVAPPPKPYFTSVKPAFAKIGDKAKITFNGANFSKNYKLFWGGKELKSVYKSDTEIETADPVDFSAATLGEIDVYIKHDNGEQTPTLKYAVLNRYAPTITSITPPVQERGQILADFVLKGTGFALTSVILFNGKPGLTRFLSPTEIRLTAADATSLNAGGYNIQVQNGSRKSNAHPVYLTEPPKPQIDYTSPSSYRVDSKSPFTLYVYGQNFSYAPINPSNATLLFTAPDGTDLSKRFVWAFGSTTYMRGTLDITSLLAGKYTIQIKNHDGVLSNKTTFRLTPPPPPVLVSSSPSTVYRGGKQPQSLLLTGSNFATGDQVIFNDNLLNPIPGTLANGQLSASITLGNIRRGGKYNLYVRRCLDQSCSQSQKTQTIQLTVNDPPCSLVNCATGLANVEKCDTTSTPNVCRPTCTQTSDCTALDSKATWTCQSGVCK